MQGRRPRCPSCSPPLPPCLSRARRRKGVDAEGVAEAQNAVVEGALGNGAHTASAR